MKKYIIENPLAFPATWREDVPHGYEFGMTLKNYFEAKAMQALITVNYIKNEDGEDDVRYDYEELAIEAYYYADELLKERSN